MNQNKNLMTKQGYEQLLTRKDEVEKRLRDAGQRAGEAAGIDSDWHDNPAYDEAVMEINTLQAILAEISAKLLGVEFIVEKNQSDTVEIGCTVTVEIDGDEEVYKIGGEPDSDPSIGIISYKAPLAQAIIGRSTGDVVEFQGPAGTFKVTIIKIGE